MADPLSAKFRIQRTEQECNFATSRTLAPTSAPNSAIGIHWQTCSIASPLLQ